MEFLPLTKYALKNNTSNSIIKKSIPLQRKNKFSGEKNEISNGSRNHLCPLRKIAVGVEKEIGESVTSLVADDRKERRIFVNMKKKITNEDDIRALHKDIISVRFPRNKNTRWCWAVFESKQKALEAFRVLEKRNDIIVNVFCKNKKKHLKLQNKLEKVKNKKSIKEKLRQSWM